MSTRLQKPFRFFYPSREFDTPHLEEINTSLHVPQNQRYKYWLQKMSEYMKHMLIITSFLKESYFRLQYEMERVIRPPSRV